MNKPLVALIGAAILPALAFALPAQARTVQTAPGRSLLARAAPGPGHRLGSALTGDPAPSRWPHHRFGSFGSALAGTAPVPAAPAGIAVDTATDTIYVSSGNNDDGPNPRHPSNTIAVIDGSHCQASNVARCKGPWPTVKVGDRPSAIAVDQATDTVYVTNAAGNTVSVINGATCNAHVSSGCGHKPATVPVGSAPVGIFADQANHTVYVANFNGNTVSMINSATCTGSHLAGCPTQHPPTVAVGGGPGDVDVNEITHSVYVTTLTGMTIFAENTCAATVQTGCGHVGNAVAPGIGTPACTQNVIPSCGGFSAKVDAGNNTIYEADGTTVVSVFNGRTCEASDLAGCATHRPGTVTVAPPDGSGFEADIWVAVDAPLHTIYVANQKDDDLSVINAKVCDGSHLAACATLRPPTIHTGEDPESVALNLQTQTLYTANQVTNDVSVIEAATCNAIVTRGCRRPPPAIAMSGPGGSAADPAVHTVYVTTGQHTVTMIDSRACNVHHLAGCARRPARVHVGLGPLGVAVNPRTHTAYVASSGETTGTVTVLDDRTCNATTTTGCASARTLHVPGGRAFAAAVNPVTDTVYIATVPSSAGKSGTVSVFNGATCNATTAIGCGQAPHTAPVGFGPQALAVNTATDTVYVTNAGAGTVSVIDGATCNGANTTGCAQPPDTITVGPASTTPVGVTIDQATDTIYVANLEDGEGSGTVSVINGTACNATSTTGCGHTPPTVTVGFGPTGIAFDPASATVVVANIEDTSVSVINAATCNATITSGCQHAQPSFPVGRAPDAIAIDPAARTAYISNLDNTVSVIPAGR